MDEHVRRQIEQNIGRGEYQTTGLDHRDIPLLHGIHDQLTEPRINEYHFDHDDTDNQVGEVDDDDDDDGRPRVRQRVVAG